MGAFPGLQAKRDLEMIYKSIAERLRIRLNSADFTLNSLLPGEKKLAEEFAVSRMTIRKAIDLLVAWGLVVRRHGSGTYRTQRCAASNRQPDRAGGGVKRQGKTVTSQVLIFLKSCLRLRPLPASYGFKSTSRSTSPVAFVLWKGNR